MQCAEAIKFTLAGHDARTLDVKRAYPREVQSEGAGQWPGARASAASACKPPCLYMAAWHVNVQFGRDAVRQGCTASRCPHLHQGAATCRSKGIWAGSKGHTCSVCNHSVHSPMQHPCLSRWPSRRRELRVWRQGNDCTPVLIEGEFHSQTARDGSFVVEYAEQIFFPPANVSDVHRARKDANEATRGTFYSSSSAHLASPSLPAAPSPRAEAIRIVRALLKERPAARWHCANTYKRHETAEKAGNDGALVRNIMPLVELLRECHSKLDFRNN